MGSYITLREANATEWEVVRDFEMGARSGIYRAAETNDEVFKYFENGTIYFILEAGLEIGFIAYRELDSTNIEIDSIVIEKSHRGHGYTKIALDALLDLIGTFNMTMVIHPRNTPAIVSFLKAGFVIDNWDANTFGDGEPRLILKRKREFRG